MHQVYPCKVFVARHHPDEVFSRDVHETRQAGSAGDENSFESHFMQIFVRERFSYDAIGYEFDTHFSQTIDFHVYDAVGQTKFRDSVFQNASDFVESFEYGYRVSFFYHVACK